MRTVATEVEAEADIVTTSLQRRRHLSRRRSPAHRRSDRDHQCRGSRLLRCLLECVLDFRLRLVSLPACGRIFLLPASVAPAFRRLVGRRRSTSSLGPECRRRECLERLQCPGRRHSSCAGRRRKGSRLSSVNSAHRGCHPDYRVIRSHHRLDFHQDPCHLALPLRKLLPAFALTSPALRT